MKMNYVTGELPVLAVSSDGDWSTTDVVEWSDETSLFEAAEKVLEAQSKRRR